MTGPEASHVMPGDGPACARREPEGASPPRAARVVDRLAAGALLAFVVWSVCGEAWRTGGLGPAVLDDYAIARSRSLAILAHADYGWQVAGEPPWLVFAYPPPYALLHAALAGAGPRAGPALFMTALVLASVAAGYAALRCAGAGSRPLRWLAVLLAVASCREFVQTDLHLLNGNVLVVAPALGAWALLAPGATGRGRGVLAGLLLALSLAVKPWAAGLAVAALVLRRGRAVAALVASGGLLLVVWPVLAVGPAGWLDLTASWLALLVSLMDPRAAATVVVDNVSLPGAFGALGWQGVAGRAGLRALQGAWLLAVVAPAVSELRRYRAGQGGTDRRWLRLGATLLAAPAPLSAIFQLHHAVSAVPLAGVVALDALRSGLPASARAGRIALLVAVFLLSTYAGAGPVRGLACFACLVLLLVAAWWPLGDVGVRKGRGPACPAHEGL